MLQTRFNVKICNTLELTPSQVPTSTYVLRLAFATRSCANPIFMQRIARAISTRLNRNSN